MSQSQAPPRASHPHQSPRTTHLDGHYQQRHQAQQQTQMHAPHSDSPPGADAALAAAKKKKKKGKGKRVEDGYETPDSRDVHQQQATYQQSGGVPAAPNQLPQGAYAATAQAQADLLATASDLYRRIEADPQGLPDDDAYWTSLPAHLRTFIRNALPLGKFPATTNNDPNARHASTQAMIAVAQQLAQAAHATQRHLYPSLPFDPAIFADLALHSDQPMPLHNHPNGNNPSVPGQPVYSHAHFSTGPNAPPTQPPGEPLPLLYNDYADETGDYEEDYYDEDEPDGANGAMTDGAHPLMHDVSQWRTESGRTVPHPSVNGNGIGSVQAPAAAKKKNKKKKKKTAAMTSTDAPAAPPTPVTPAKQPSTYNPAQHNNGALPSGGRASPAGAPRSGVPPPSSRAAGKQPMTFNSNAASKAAPNGHSHPPAPKRSASSVTGPHGNAANSSAPGHSHPHGPPHPPPQQRIWSTSTAEERERIKDFWLGLTDSERRNLVQVEKQAVLTKMKESQKHTCTCAVCGRKRSAIESELEVLYNMYFEELQQYANHQQQYVKSAGAIPPPPGPGPFPGSIALDSAGNVIGGNALTKAPAAQKPRTAIPQKKALPLPEDDDEYDDDLDDEDYDDDYDEEEEDDEDDVPPPDNTNRRRTPAGNQAPTPTGNDVFPLGTSLTVKGGILTVADDLLKNDGQKFLEMMEQLADRRMQREGDAAAELDRMSEEDADEDDGVELDDDEEEEEDLLTRQQKTEEGRKMFQVFAARLFEQRVLNAYLARVSDERQKELLRELQQEQDAQQEKEARRQKENQKKKDKKKQMQQKKEEERLRKENEKAAEEAAQREKLEQQRAAELKKQEELRAKKEAERKAKEDERLRKEEERRRRVEEERAKEAEKERKRKEKEEKARLEREAKEAKEAEARRERELKEREEQERRASEERKAAEARQRAAQEKKEKEQAEKTAAQAKAKAEQQKAANASASQNAVNAAGSTSPSASRGPSSGKSPSGPAAGRARSQTSVPPSPANAAPVAYARPPPSVQGSANIPARPTGGHHSTAQAKGSASGSTLPALPQGLPARPTSSKTPASQSSAPGASAAPTSSGSTSGSSSLSKAPTASQPASSLTGPASAPAVQPNFLNASSLNPVGTSPTPSTTTKATAPQPAAVQPQPAVSTSSRSAGTSTPQSAAPSNPFAFSAPGFGSTASGFDSLRSTSAMNDLRSPLGHSSVVGSGKSIDGIQSSTTLDQTSKALSSMNLGYQNDAFGFGRGSSSPFGPAVPSPQPGLGSADNSVHPSPSQASRSTIQRPGPIGPIGRPRQASDLLEEAGPLSATGSMRSVSPPRLPEGRLGSSALGGDDELIDPQPRRTSSTVPIGGGTPLYGFNNSTWGSSSFASPPASAASAPTAGFASLAGPNAGLPSGLGGLGGSGAGLAAGGRGSGSGMITQPDPWGSSTSRSATQSSSSSSWDRARHAFEQPGGGNATSNSAGYSHFSSSQQQPSQHPQLQSHSSFHHHQQQPHSSSPYGHFAQPPVQQQGLQQYPSSYGQQPYGGLSQPQGFGGQPNQHPQYQQPGSGGAHGFGSGHNSGYGRSIFDTALPGSPAQRNSTDRGY